MGVLPGSHPPAHKKKGLTSSCWGRTGLTNIPHSNLSTAEGLSPKIPPPSLLHKFAFWLWPALQKCFALRHNCSSSMSPCKHHHVP